VSLEGEYMGGVGLGGVCEGLFMNEAGMECCVSGGGIYGRGRVRGCL